MVNWRPAGLALLALISLRTLGQELEGKATLSCVADTSIHSFPGDANEPSEWALRSGNSKRIKIKHREDQLLLRFDVHPIPHRAKIASAVLRLFVEGGPKYALNHICISTVSTDWDELTANFLEAAEGRAWGPGNLHFPAVVFGNFGTITSLARAKDAGGCWWEIPVAPRVVHALRDSFGMAVMDETGIFSGDSANIFVASRESEHPPELIVTWSGQDSVPPASVRELQLVAGPEAGSLFLDMVCGGNDGEKGQALGYEIRYQKGKTFAAENWDTATILPRLLTPRPKSAGARLRTLIEDLEPGMEYSFGLVAYDESDNRSPLAISPPGRAREKTVDRFDQVEPAREPDQTLQCGPLTVWATDALQQIDPVTGKALVGADYQEPCKSAKAVLTALKGEQTDFQIILEIKDKPVTDIRFTFSDLLCDEKVIRAANLAIERIWYLKAGQNWFPNATPVLNKGETLAIPTSNDIPDQKFQAFYINLFVPYDTAAGEYKGSVRIESSAGTVILPIALKVVDLTMPERLNFEIELNQYSDRQPKEAFHELHRLAHLHRTGYNVLPYSHNGTPTVAYVPGVTGWGREARVTDWTVFDAWMGPLLDGSAFKDLPRSHEPLRWSYLPFYENYPMPLYKGYQPADLIANRPNAANKAEYDKWLDRCGREEPLIETAFLSEWFDGNRAVTAQFMQHFAEKGWNRTKFQVMCNNVPFKGTLTAWTLDEPAWGRDFRALALFYKTFVSAARSSGAGIEVVARNGVSRPEWQGDRLDEVSEFNDIAGGPMREYYPLIRRRMLERGDTYWTYGGGLSATKDVAMLQALVIEAYARGQIGVLPAWTAFDGGPKAWDEDKPLALAVPGTHGYSGWTATLKLKALRRAQQDVELLQMLAQRPAWDRWRVSRAIFSAMSLDSKKSSNPPENVTQTDFSHARQEDFRRLRAAVINELLKKN